MSIPSTSVPIEPIPAKEPIGFETDSSENKPLTGQSQLTPACPGLPTDDFVQVQGMTSEDLENQYKSLLAAREMEKLNQPVSHPTDQSA